jgi:hypothetical protein
MRTTLTVDPDLADALRKKAHRARKPFKQVVNETLRAGLVAQEAPPGRRYRLNPVSLGGIAPGIDLDRALRLADALADDALARKLELRKW